MLILRRGRACCIGRFLVIETFFDGVVEDGAGGDFGCCGLLDGRRVVAEGEDEGRTFLQGTAEGEASDHDGLS